MDAVDSTGLVIPVSVWIKHLETHGVSDATSSPRCVVVMEPVDRTTATLFFDSKVREGFEHAFKALKILVSNLHVFVGNACVV